MNLLHLTCLYVGVLTLVQILGAPPPFLKFGRAKNVQKSVRFTTTFMFERKYLCEIPSTTNEVISANVDLP